MTNITTAGWDTVFALRLSHVNELLHKALDSRELSLPPLNWLSDTDGISVHLNGFAFVGDASLSGSKAKVAFSAGPGTLNYQGKTTATGPAKVIGMLDLRRIDDPHFVAISINPASDFQISHIDGLTLTPLEQTVYKLFFQKAVSACLPNFKPVLAKIDLQSKLPDSAKWLKPVAVGHCISGGTDASGNADAGSTLAVLCMTDPFQAGNPTPTPSFDAAIIPSGAKAAFMISGPKFTRNLLFAGVAQGLFSPGKPMSADQLAQIGQNRLQITGADGAEVIQMKPGSAAISLGTTDVDVSPLYAVFANALLMPVTIPAAVLTLLGTLVGELIAHGKPNIILPVPVILQSLDVSRIGDTVRFNMGVSCAVNLGQLELATVTMTIGTNYQLKVSQGNFQFVRVGDPFISNKNVSLPKWLGASETVAGVIATILGVIVTIVTEGEAAVLIGISIGLIEAGLAATPQLISVAVSQGAGVAVPASLDGFIATAVSPVAWLNATPFKAESLALGEAILFSGELT